MQKTTQIWTQLFETPLLHKVVHFQMPPKNIKRLPAWNLYKFRKEITFFSKNYVTSEGAVSHKVLYNQQLSIARFQLIFVMLTIILSNYP